MMRKGISESVEEAGRRVKVEWVQAGEDCRRINQWKTEDSFAASYDWYIRLKDAFHGQLSFWLMTYRTFVARYGLSFNVIVDILQPIEYVITEWYLVDPERSGKYYKQEETALYKGW